MVAASGALYMACKFGLLFFFSTSVLAQILGPERKAFYLLNSKKLLYPNEILLKCTHTQNAHAANDENKYEIHSHIYINKSATLQRQKGVGGGGGWI